MMKKAGSSSMSIGITTSILCLYSFEEPFVFII